jgi:hypothetical protein
MTRTLEEVTADMQKQGSISPEYIETLNQAKERNEQAMATPQFAEEPVASSPATVQEVPQSVAKPNVEKTIICPNCGEIIHLA